MPTRRADYGLPGHGLVVSVALGNDGGGLAVDRIGDARAVYRNHPSLLVDRQTAHELNGGSVTHGRHAVENEPRLGLHGLDVEIIVTRGQREDGQDYNK